MPPRVFVIGAGGTTGLATVRSLRTAGFDVIAGVHSMNKSAAPLERLGASVRHVEFEDVTGMAAAMSGADRLFVVTPVTHETERLTALIAEAAKAAGIGYVAKLSGLGVDSEPEFALGRWHRAAERVIEAAGLDWTFLRPNAFMQNFCANADSVKEQGIFYSPLGPAAVSYIDARDIGEVAAEVLSTDGHAGQIYSLTGPKVIHRETSQSS